MYGHDHVTNRVTQTTPMRPCQDVDITNKSPLQFVSSPSRAAMRYHSLTHSLTHSHTHTHSCTLNTTTSQRIVDDFDGEVSRAVVRRDHPPPSHLRGGALHFQQGPLTHSLTHSLTNALTHSLTHSLMHAHTLPHSLTHSRSLAPMACGGPYSHTQHTRPSNMLACEIYAWGWRSLGLWCSRCDMVVCLMC